MNADKLIDFSALEPDIQGLINESIAVREHSYSPYSKFKVGAAVLCSDGTIFSGCNIENASYPAGTCAEKVAIGKAVSEGKRKFKALVVVADKKDNGSFVAPCGVCRQHISEFGDIPIYLSGPDMKNVFKTTTSNLLPYAFDMSYLTVSQ